jgi:pyrroloquinoline quinone (PQQ) biosynthesis protein C
MDLKSLTTRLLIERKFKEEVFFISLHNGTMTKEQFIKTQYQFYHAVVNFVAPLFFVAGNTPAYDQRIKIIKNLWEEHGEGDIANTHVATFDEFLRRLTNSEVKHQRSLAAVNLFNRTLNETSKNDYYLKSIAMLGMIELMFSDISHFIGSALIERGWMTSKEIIHYKVHKDLDVIHAQDFFDIIEKEMVIPNQEIEKGLLLGRDTFLNFYHGLFSEACL